MALKQTDVGDLKILGLIRAAWNAGSPVKMHLVKADWTPSEATVAGDMTEADFAGYAAVNATTWTAPHTVSGKGRTEADAIVFTRSSTGTAQTIYGYWAEDTTDAGKVLWSEKFASTVTLTNADDALILYPRYTQNTE